MRYRSRVRGRAASPRAVPILLATAAALPVVSACAEEPPVEPERPTLSLAATLSGDDTAGYARATDPTELAFPRDHGPHPRFRTEWWYVTGNLVGEGGRDFGFQLTIFRNALAPIPPGGPSRWATNQAYMGHFALTDVAGGRFHAYDRFARGAAGLAGARAEPLRVWIEDWVLESARPAGSTFPLRLRADAGTGIGEAPDGGDSEGGAGQADEPDAGGVELDLTLERGKPMVLQGDDGLSQKGPEPGNASYYYSFTRMPAQGRIVVEGDTVAVTGLAWLDREWSTSALSSGQVGWDWFALQLADGWELMVYRLRREDGGADPLSDGALIDPEGRRHALEWGTEVVVDRTGTWRSPMDGTDYPSGWRIRVPARGWDLRVTPVLEDQELRLAFRYWEGAVRVEGTGEGGAAVEGRGYVELTGYDGALGRR